MRSCVLFLIAIQPWKLVHSVVLGSAAVPVQPDIKPRPPSKQVEVHEADEVDEVDEDDEVDKGVTGSSQAAGEAKVNSTANMIQQLAERIQRDEAIVEALAPATVQHRSQRKLRDGRRNEGKGGRGGGEDEARDEDKAPAVATPTFGFPFGFPMFPFTKLPFAKFQHVRKNGTGDDEEGGGNGTKNMSEADQKKIFLDCLDEYLFKPSTEQTLGRCPQKDRMMKKLCETSRQYLDDKKYEPFRDKCQYLHLGEPVSQKALSVFASTWNAGNQVMTSDNLDKYMDDLVAKVPKLVDLVVLGYQALVEDTLAERIKSKLEEATTAKFSYFRTKQRAGACAENHRDTFLYAFHTTGAKTEGNESILQWKFAESPVDMQRCQQTATSDGCFMPEGSTCGIGTNVMRLRATPFYRNGLPTGKKPIQVCALNAYFNPKDPAATVAQGMRNAIDAAGDCDATVYVGDFNSRFRAALGPTLQSVLNASAVGQADLLHSMLTTETLSLPMAMPARNPMARMGFREPFGGPMFAPTYKVQPCDTAMGGEEEDAQPDPEAMQSCYYKADASPLHVPAYADRVIYATKNHSEVVAKAVSYKSMPTYYGSDHWPVFAEIAFDTGLQWPEGMQPARSLLPLLLPSSLTPPVQVPPPQVTSVAEPPPAKPVAAESPPTEPPAAKSTPTEPPAAKSPPTEPPAAKSTPTEPPAAKSTPAEPPAAESTPAEPPAAKPPHAMSLPQDTGILQGIFGAMKAWASR